MTMRFTTWSEWARYRENGRWPDPTPQERAACDENHRLDSTMISLRRYETVEGELAAARDRVATLAAIEALSDPEGASVTICCPNPDFNGLPDRAIEVVDDWTAWEPRIFRGKTLIECLNLALAARSGRHP